MQPFQSASVRANGIQIHYYRATPPGGGPALLFSHGLTDNGLCWGRTADALRQQFDVILPDTRGHGLSEKPDAGYSISERAADVAGLIDALGLERPIVFGHSMGGETVMAAAGLYPDKVGGAVLEDPAWFDTANPDNTVSIDEATLRGWVDGLLQHQGLERAALADACRRDNPRWHADDVAAWVMARSQMSPQALTQILTSLRGGWREHVRAAQCPILLITGDTRRGVIVSPAMAAECAALWQRGQVVNIPGAGHNIRRERFGLYLRAVKEFLGV